MAVWPISSIPLQDGYSPVHEPSTIRTEMEQGPDRLALIHDTIITMIPCSFVVTSAEYQTFMNWYRNTINVTDWFDINVDTQGVIVAHRARIVGPIQSRPDGSEYLLTMTIETDELNT